jgi:hypothetical protein
MSKLTKLKLAFLFLAISPCLSVSTVENNGSTGEVWMKLTPQAFAAWCVSSDGQRLAPPAIGDGVTRWLFTDEWLMSRPNARQKGADRMVVVDLNSSSLVSGLRGNRGGRAKALQTARRLFGFAAERIGVNTFGIPTQSQQTVTLNDPSLPQQGYRAAVGIPSTLSESMAVPNPGSITGVVIDSGVSVAQPDILQNLDTADSQGFGGISPLADPGTTGFFSAFPHGHGTQMASIGGETCDNGVEGAGIDCQGRFISFGIFYPTIVNGVETLTTTSTIVTQALYALLDIPGKLAVTMSFEFPEDTETGLWEDAINAVGKRGAFIAAAGNDGAAVKVMPCAINSPYLKCVTAIDSNGRLASFANYGPWVHLAAPGVNICSAANDGSFQCGDGTSPAAAITYGVTKLLWRFQPWLDSDQLLELVVNGATYDPMLAGLLEAPRQLSYTGSRATQERGTLIAPPPPISITEISPDATQLPRGQVVSVSGSNFTDITTETAATGTSVTLLNGVQVFLTQSPAAQLPLELLSVGPDQIRFVIPNDSFRVPLGANTVSVLRLADLTSYTMSTLSYATASITVVPPGQ